MILYAIQLLYIIQIIKQKHRNLSEKSFFLIKYFSVWEHNTPLTSKFLKTNLLKDVFLVIRFEQIHPETHSSSICVQSSVRLVPGKRYVGVVNLHNCILAHHTRHYIVIYHYLF